MTIWLDATRPPFPVVPPVRYDAEYPQLRGPDWIRFAEYYLQKRGLSVEVVSKILKDPSSLIPGVEADKLLADLQKSVQHNDLLGQLGEIITTYMLEKRENVFSYKLCWPERPFDVIRGVDLAGVCLSSWLVVLTEIKASESTGLASQLQAARDDLSCVRVVPRFQLNLDDGRSRRSAVVALRRAMREGRLSGCTISPDNIEQLLSGDRFVRVGAIIHSKLTAKYNYKQTLKLLRTDDLEFHGHKGCPEHERNIKSNLPTVILDVDVDDFKTRIREWIQLEHLLNNSKIGDV
jgi:hypothetical protein